ncbi:MAG: acetylxylan esterase [Spirochaetes bacterium]|nr:acetylxylan esterase [Spirochaetota bacterium]
MASLINFDKYFANFPQMERETDFDFFWKNSLIDLKRIAIEPVSHENTRLSSPRFTVMDIAYKSFGKTAVQARLYMPKKRKHPRPVIIIHDYLEATAFKGYKLETDFAYLFLTLRGHQILKGIDFHNQKKGFEVESPGYMIENIMDPENYYLKGVYLDCYRAIDLLRLYKDIDCSSIGVIGKGIGGAAAAFCASSSKRISAVVLDSLSFADLPKSQNLAEGPVTTEINDFVSSARGKRKILRRNLSYFDAVHFCDRFETPLLMTTGIKSVTAPAECIFSFFNASVSCDKTMEIYPDDGESAGGAHQFKKSLSWLKKMVYIK